MTAAQLPQPPVGLLPAGLTMTPARPLSQRLLAPALVAGALVVVGALLGLVWAWWSPSRPDAIFLPAGTEPLGESEALIRADGRFLVLGAVVGIVAGLATWFWLRTRGPLMPLALGIGGVLGSLAMWGVGYLIGGGDGTGKKAHLTDGTAVYYTKHLPLELQMHGLLFVEAGLAVLIYGLFASFTARDDLGHPDPRDRSGVPALPPGFGGPPVFPQPANLMPPPYAAPPPTGMPPAVAAPAEPVVRPRPTPGPRSVDPGGQPQGGWGHGDAPGAPQQGDLPPQ